MMVKFVEEDPSHPTAHISPVPSAYALPRPVMYACIRACLKKAERDDRGIGRGVKGRGVSWLFVLHCSHPCDQSREETFRALL